MLNKISRTLQNLYRNQKGMTGLETAIILIAFVTVASVLSYSVLSAGIFSAEKGKEAVYKGLDQAQGNLLLKGDVLATSEGGENIDEVIFNVALTIPNQVMDMDAVVVNYWDSEVHAEGLNVEMAVSSGSTERGTVGMLEGDEQFTVTVTLPDDAEIGAYDTFYIQIIPPTGATLTVKRSVPGVVLGTTDLY
jgi:archaeal flagellin FlaB